MAELHIYQPREISSERKNGDIAFQGNLPILWTAFEDEMISGGNSATNMLRKLSGLLETDRILESRNLKDGDWYWVPKAIIQNYTPEVGALGIVVYNFLASMADKTQRCFPSQVYIARHLGYSRTAIHKAIKRLEQHGLIKREKRCGYHCVYRLLKVTRCQPGETKMSLPGNSDVNRVDTNNTKLIRIKNDINIKDLQNF